MPQRIVIAPDSFKGSLPAVDVAASIADGWRVERPSDELVLLPQADGGEGTLDAIQAAVPTSIRRDAGWVTGPDGRLVRGEWLELSDGTAVVEMAQVSGLPMMKALDPLGATSVGLGEVIAAALDSDASRLLIGVGGSASTDGGIPVLQALGARTPPRDGAYILSDVNSPLLGPYGAAAVFGPQKGATPGDVAVLESRLSAVAAQLGGDPDQPGSGAAGGVGFALQHWGAQQTSGATYLAEVTGLITASLSADIVITGEGRYDDQSLLGKVVGSVLRCAEAGVAVPAIIAGQATAQPDCWHITLVDIAGSLAAALADPHRWLRAAGRRAAHNLP